MASGGRGDDTHPTSRKGKEKAVAPHRRRMTTRIIEDVSRFFSFGSTRNPTNIPSTETTTAPIAPEVLTQHATEVPTHQASTSGISAGSYHTTGTPTPSDDDEDDVDSERLHDVSDEEVEMSPDGRVAITPAGNAFLPSKPSSTAITSVIKENYNKPWTTWGKIKKSEADRSMMLKAFNDKCIWIPEHTAEVERILSYTKDHEKYDQLCWCEKVWLVWLFVCLE